MIFERARPESASLNLGLVYCPPSPLAQEIGSAVTKQVNESCRSLRVMTTVAGTARGLVDTEPCSFSEPGFAGGGLFVAP